MNSITFLDQNKKVVEKIIIIHREEFSALYEDVLKKRPAENKWSVIECLDHMNLAAFDYLKQFQRALDDRKFKPAKQKYRAGILGSMFTNMMRPDSKSRIKWKMKTMNSMIPEPANLNVRKIMQTFEEQNLLLLDIIERSREIDISKPRIVSALGPLLKFKFGDALSFIVAHSERHTLQAQNALEALKKNDTADKHR